MRLVQLADVAPLSPKEVIPYTKGVLKCVFKRTVNGDQGPDRKWDSIQNSVIAEGQTEIKIKACDQPAIPEEWKGKVVHIFCKEGDKGLSGVYRDENDNYKGKSSVVVKVTHTGTITLADGQASQPTQDAPRAAEPATRPNTPPPAQTPRSAPPANGTNHSKGPVPMGATVGMAINNACASLTAQGIELKPFLIMEIASDILRASHWLEAGNLSPKWSERHKPAGNPPAASPPPAAAPPPPPAPEPAEPVDDIPF